MKRLFIGLQIPENVIQGLQALPTELTGAIWKTSDKYHLTLQFVGNVEEPVADEIEQELKFIRFPAFQLALKEIGYFANGDIPHHLWAGVTPDKALRELQKKIENAVKKLQKESQDKFKFHPHVTLAKLVGTSVEDVFEYIAQNNLYHSPEWQVTSFCLFESHAKENGEGKYYTVRAEYPLSLI